MSDSNRSSKAVREICAIPISAAIVEFRAGPLSELGTLATSARFDCPTIGAAKCHATECAAGQRYAVFRIHLTGRAFALGGDGAGNLDGLFNGRASSLLVDRGYWIFCSDANFGGECRTFGPGEYPVLPRELDNRISSGRRISNAYPYTDNPNWR